VLTYLILAVVATVFVRGLLTFCPLTWMYAGEIGEALAKVGKALFTAVCGRSD
jgi:hypothetical protein